MPLLMLRLSFAVLLVLSGCASSRTVRPIVTTLNYVTTAPASAALDSVHVWAESIEGLTLDRDSSSLAIRDMRPATSGQTLVKAAARADGLTQMTLRTEHVFSDSQPVSMAWHYLIWSAPEVFVLPANGFDPVCRSVASWRDALTRRVEPRDPVGESSEMDERAPVLVGGLSGLGVQYPEALRRAGIQGKVVVLFVVDENGAVECAESILSPHPQLSEAALVAVRRARFTPGMQRGEAVRVRFSLPISFRLR